MRAEVAAGLRDLDDDVLREAGALKWSIDPPGVIPAWIAEMDFALAQPVHAAVMDYAARGVFGYADPNGPADVAQALVGFAQRHWGQRIDPELIQLTGDVMEGLALALTHLAPAGPVIIPTPVYPPFLVLSESLDREMRLVPLMRRAGETPPGAAPLTLDLAQIEEHARQGARTLLLCHPHNPVGRCYAREELVALAEVVERFDVHVISDEIHAPLTLPGIDFVPYAAVASPEAPVTTLISATKSFSMPGLRCAQLISHRSSDHAVIAGLHPVLNHSMNTLGQRATVAAYTSGDDWLREVRARIAANHTMFRESLAAKVPEVSMESAEATYLGWLDVSRLAMRDPVAAALAHGVRLDSQREGYGPGSADHVRVNLGTSPQRVAMMAERLARAWAPSA